MRCAMSWWVSLAFMAAGLTGCQQDVAPTPAPASPVAATGTPPTTPAATNRSASAPIYSDKPLANLPTIKLLVGANEVTTQLALKPIEMATGMMHRAAIDPEEAMLFVMPRPMQASFYNRNVHFDLGVAYLDSEGVIQEIVTLKKLDETPVPSKSHNIQFVFEVAPDWFQRKGVGVGTLVMTTRGPLRQAFTFN